MFRDYAKLHFIILIWGFTGILGFVIDLPSEQVVFWRTLLAAISLRLLLQVMRVPTRLPRKTIIHLIATGVLVGAHWVFFFWAVKLGGASIGMIGLSTATLWTALLAPLFIRRRISWLEIVLGITVVASLVFIAQANYDKTLALLLSIIAALIASVFSFINGNFTRSIHHNVIAMYEMIGALFVSTAAVPLSHWSVGGTGLGFKLPSTDDWICLFVLSTFCTVYAYGACVELLKRISVFATQLSVNIEPVYGIILAAFLLDEHKLLNVHFYIGSMILIVAVLVYPMLQRRILR